MKTTVNSSNDFNEEIRRLFSGMLLGSLFLILSSAHLSGQCSITLTSGAGSDNQTVCINTAINIITYSTTEATGATFTGLPSGVTGNWADSVVTISGTPSEAGNFNFTINAAGGICENITTSGVISVNNMLPVSVSIAADANPVCEGTTVNFIATPFNGGTTPSYQWYVDGTPAGAIGATYSYMPDDGNAITCLLTSDMGCVSDNPATSNIIQMTVNPLPVVTFDCSDPDRTFYTGTNITFTAGGGALYGFLIDGTSVQNGSENTYSTTTLTDGQVVSVISDNLPGMQRFIFRNRSECD